MKKKENNSIFHSAWSRQEEILVVASGLALATVAILHATGHQFYWEQQRPWWEETGNFSSMCMGDIIFL